MTGTGLVSTRLSTGTLAPDRWSDPRDESGYSADDLIRCNFQRTA